MAIIRESWKNMKEQKNNKNKRYVIGVDPGSGSKSACGLALYDRLENKVIETKAIWAEAGRDKPTWHRIKSVALQVGLYISETSVEKDDLEVHIEWFIMKGIGGQTLQRLIGSVMTLLPYHIKVEEVHNIGTKKNLTGRSVADKEQMGQALLERLHIDNYEYVQTLIKESRWDEIDAIAIALNNDFR